MTVLNLLNYFLFWGFLGIFLFSIFVIIVFRTGLIFESREKTGTLKKKVSVKAVLLSLSLLFGLVLIQCLSVLFHIKPFHPIISFRYLFLLNFSLYLIFLIYDTLFIDFIVICIWKPDFLRIPVEMNFSTMKQHIFLSLPIGTVLGGLVSLFSSWLCKSLIL